MVRTGERGEGDEDIEWGEDEEDARPLADGVCSSNAAELRELANGVRRRWAKRESDVTVSV